MHLDPLVGLLLTLLVNRYRQWRYRSPDAATDFEAAAPPREGGGIEKIEEADAFIRDLNTQKDIALNELRLAQEITRAVDDAQFVPWLQPIVTLPERRLMGFEALVRWQHPKRGMVSPAEFIPVAERTHAVWDIDMAMLRAACALAAQVQAAAGGLDRKLYISVNLSGVYFDNADIVKEVAEVLRKSGADPQHLVFEITESALMGDPAAAEKILLELRKTGARIALDDFGTGYSSLSYLHRFPIDLLKIDRSFVHDMSQNRKSVEIVRAIVDLAKNFHLQIVGEGVESDQEIGLLSGIGCDFGQGYFFSKPMPFDKALEYVRDSVKKYG
jgi:EAL domain-containing protein (putative c-di-GMP-specific phosphodiesterase class I)